MAMKERKHLYVSRKNVLTWLMVLCMAGSAVTRILMVGVKGADLWSQIVLPIAAALLFALITLISGKERFYKTAIPVWGMAVYYCFLFASYSFGDYHKMIVGLYGLSVVCIAVFYSIVTGGKAGYTWMILPLLLFPPAAQLYLERRHLMAGALVPDALMTGGVFLTLLGSHIYTDGLYHPTWGDRPDGRRIRSLPPISQVSPYLMVHRNESSNLASQSFEISHVERYIRQKRKEGLSNFGILHVLMACYCRAICKFPAINRFLSGQKVFSRGEDIQFCMTIKKEMTTSAPDSVIKVHLNPHDTAYDIYRKMNQQVEEVKNTPLDSSFDNTAGFISLIPGVFLKFVVWLLKLLDYFGLLPKFLLEVSPFHGSVFFTSMGSLGIPPIYHHLYDFGNLPVFCAFGAKRRVMEVQEDGSLVQKKYVDLNITTDERIVDGFYYAAFLKHFSRLMRHPEQFDLPPEEVLPDID